MTTEQLLFCFKYRHMTGTLMKDAFYGKGSGPIWRLRNGCSSDVAKCLLPDGEHTDCSHSDDIGVFCNRMCFKSFVC